MEDKIQYSKENPQTQIRTFGRRIGKSLSETQKRYLEVKLPQFIFDPAKTDLSKISGELILEIGFGMGENLVEQALSNPEALFIGAEVYQNGLANVLILAEKKNTSNIMIWPKDFKLISEKLPKNVFSKIYILFPDPWPKNKQQKRRLISCNKSLNIILELLKNGGELIFASDIEDYTVQLERLVSCIEIDIIESSDRPKRKVKLLNQDYQIPSFYTVKTKYHKKAEDKGRAIKFLHYQIS